MPAWSNHIEAAEMVNDLPEEVMSDLGAEVLAVFEEHQAYEYDNFVPVEQLRELVLGEYYTSARDFILDHPNPRELNQSMAARHAVDQMTVRSERSRLGTTLSSLGTVLRHELQVYLGYISPREYGKCYGLALCRRSLDEIIDRLRAKGNKCLSLANEMEEIQEDVQQN